MTRALAVAACVVAGLSFAAAIPPVPRDDDTLFDAAHLLSERDADEVRAIQERSLERYGTPIVVVTVQRVGDYGSNDVQDLATRWFNAWNIGTLDLDGGANRGILLLVAVQDRRARIELGGDWGRAWDQHASRIMDQSIIPHFKNVDYAAGVLAGVRALESDFAMKGPQSSPPSHRLEDTVKKVRRYSLLPPTLFGVVLAGGVLMLIAGVVRRRVLHGLCVVHHRVTRARVLLTSERRLLPSTALR